MVSLPIYGSRNVDGPAAVLAVGSSTGRWGTRCCRDCVRSWCDVLPWGFFLLDAVRLPSPPSSFQLVGRFSVADFDFCGFCYEFFRCGFHFTCFFVYFSRRLVFRVFGTLKKVLNVVVFRCTCLGVVMRLYAAIWDGSLSIGEIFADAGSRSGASEDLVRYNASFHRRSFFGLERRSFCVCFPVAFLLSGIMVHVSILVLSFYYFGKAVSQSQ